MRASDPSLIANMSFYGAVSYFHCAAYGAAKAGADKLAFDMASGSAAARRCVGVIWPGYVLTETLAAIPRGYLPPASFNDLCM